MILIPLISLLENQKMVAVCALCAFFAFLLYFNTLHADFAYDDSRAILKNPDLLNTTPLVNLFYDDFWGTPLTHSGSHKSFRPLCVLSFRLNHALGGLNPFGYHLGNLLVHTLVTGLWTHVAGILLKSRSAALFSGLLFAAHPIHTEAVAGIVGRADLGACLFFLLSFLAYIEFSGGQGRNCGKRKWMPLCLSVFFAAVSMFFKEQGITVLAVSAIYDLLICHRIPVQPRDLFEVLTKGEYKELRKGLAALSSSGLVCLAFRLYWMGSKPPDFAPSDNPAADSDSLVTRTLTFLLLPPLNLGLLLYPYRLSFDWSMDSVPLVESPADPRNLLSLAFYATLGGAGVYCTVLRGGQRRPGTGARPSSPDSSPTETPAGRKPPRLNGNGCHHRTHHHRKPATMRRSSSDSSLSSTSSGGSWGGGSAPREPAPSRRLDGAVLGLALMAFPFLPATNLFFYVGFVMAERILYLPSLGFCLLVAAGWDALHGRSTPGRRRLLKASALAVLALFSLRTVIRNQDWLSEENLYRSGVTVNPAKAWGNLANILKTQGKLKEAEDAYRSALMHRPNMADVHYNLGILLQDMGRNKEALVSYESAIKCRPRLAMAHLNLGIVLTAEGREAQAEEVYRHAATLNDTGLKDPRTHNQGVISAIYNLGKLMHDQGRYQEAVSTFMEAVNRMPDYYSPQSLYNLLGESHFKLGQYKEAEKWFRDSLATKPDHVPAHLTYARLLGKMNRHSEARDLFERALRLEGSSSVLHHYGQYLAEQGEFGEAAKLYQKAVQVLSAPDFDIYFNAGNIHRQAELNTQAEQYYRQAVQIIPNNAHGHINLGAMLHLNGKLEEAQESYLTALRLKPDDQITKQNLQKLRSLLAKRANGRR